VPHQAQDSSAQRKSESANNKMGRWTTEEKQRFIDGKFTRFILGGHTMLSQFVVDKGSKDMEFLRKMTMFGNYGCHPLQFKEVAQSTI